MAKKEETPAEKRAREKLEKMLDEYKKDIREGT